MYNIICPLVCVYFLGGPALLRVFGTGAGFLFVLFGHADRLFVDAARPDWVSSTPASFSVFLPIFAS